MVEQQPEFGAELRRKREIAGHSQTAFARLIHYSKGYLSKVETGKATGNREFAQACDSALDAGGSLLSLMREKNRRREQVGVPALPVFGLPNSTAHFTGRDAELATVAGALSERTGAGGVCVLSGMAGAGKTALALRAAWEAVGSFPDGCAFLDLRSHDREAERATAHDVLDPLLRLLGVPGDSIPPQLDARANLYRSRLRGKRFLLVLDNAVDTAQVLPLIPAESRCRVIITSRNRLNALDEAVHVPISALPADEAATLFRSVGGEAAAGADAEVVARVVERCGRLPLAIRVAASRFRSGTAALDEFERRLADEDSRLAVLDDGDRSVVTAFSVSYRALPSAQARLFRMLALHPGREIEVRSAAALGDVDVREARGIVDRLGDAHLVGQSPAGRVLLHDLMRDFARSRLLPAVPTEECAAAVARLLDLNLRLAHRADELISPHRYRPALPPELVAPVEEFAGGKDAMSWLDREWPNLVGLCGLASGHGLHGHCWRLAFALRDFFFRTKLWDPWVDTHRTAAASARAVEDRWALAATMHNLGVAHLDRGEPGVASGCFEESLELFGELGDEHGSTNARSSLGWAALYEGEHERALRELGAALVAYRRLGNTRNAAITLRGVALVEAEVGRCAEAVRHAEESRGQFVALGLPLDEVMSVNCAAWARFLDGAHEDAAAGYAEAVGLGELCGSAYEVARAWTGLGNAHNAEGRRDEAARAWAVADEFHPSLDPVMVGEARVRVSARG